MCDIFIINKHISFEIINENIYFENEDEVKDLVISFTKGICTIQRNIADISTMMYSNILNRIRSKEELPSETEYCEYDMKEIRISSEYDTSSKNYIVRNEQGEILISLKHLSSLTDLFKLIINNINGIIHL